MENVSHSVLIDRTFRIGKIKDFCKPQDSRFSAFLRLPTPQNSSNSAGITADDTPPITTAFTPSDPLPVGKGLLDNGQYRDNSVSAGNGKSLFRKELQRHHLMKVGAEAVAKRLTFISPRTASRMSACGSRLEGRVFEDSGEFRLVSDRHCNSRLCPICSKRRSLRLFKKYSGRLKALEADYFSYHVALTYKNSDELPDFSRMKAQLRNLFRRKLWKQFSVVGGVVSFEITVSKRKQFHPHYHVILYTKHRIPCLPDGNWRVDFNQQVSEAWLRITGDSFILRGGELRNINEALKYTLKQSELSKMDQKKLKEFFEWQAGRRFFSAFGVARGLEKEVKAELEAEEKEEELRDVQRPFQAFRFEWNGKEYVLKECYRNAPGDST